MKKLIMACVLFGMIASFASQSYAAIKYVSSYTRSDGTQVSGCWKDTSGDGIKQNNANFLGLNG